VGQSRHGFQKNFLKFYSEDTSKKINFLEVDIRLNKHANLVILTVQYKPRVAKSKHRPFKLQNLQNY